MVNVINSSGKSVIVEVKGIAEAIRDIVSKGQEIKDGTDAKALQAANFLQQEIQESIIGGRGEPKSVDTGNFANSISVSKIKEGEYSVFTMVEYAKFLEYGTLDIHPRRHFGNSVDRNKKKIIEIIKS